LKTGAPYEEVKPGPDVFVTEVFKCNKVGSVKSFDCPLYEREYPDLLQAKLGHKETVDSMTRGRLTLRQVFVDSLHLNFPQ